MTYALELSIEITGIKQDPEKYLANRRSALMENTYNRLKRGLLLGDVLKICVNLKNMLECSEYGLECFVIFNWLICREYVSVIEKSCLQAMFVCWGTQFSCWEFRCLLSRYSVPVLVGYVCVRCHAIAFMRWPV